ncbi:hypothetical protein, partial [Methylocella tundrae]|uniref:hypothetical protein n=1 Tax=Methylocella tundrae TaxID=227605 RepID=UPI001AED5AA6
MWRRTPNFIRVRISDRTGHSIDQKSLQIQKLEHILVDQIEPIRPEYALTRGLFSEHSGDIVEELYFDAGSFHDERLLGDGEGVVPGPVDD